MKNVLEYLERSAKEFQDKIAVDDGTTVFTYRQLHELARRIGSAIAGHTKPGTPVPVVMDKSAETLAIYLGIVEAGCFYVPVEPDVNIAYKISVSIICSLIAVSFFSSISCSLNYSM